MFLCRKKSIANNNTNIGDVVIVVIVSTSQTTNDKLKKSNLQNANDFTHPVASGWFVYKTTTETWPLPVFLERIFGRNFRSEFLERFFFLAGRRSSRSKRKEGVGEAGRRNLVMPISTHMIVSLVLGIYPPQRGYIPIWRSIPCGGDISPVGGIYPLWGRYIPWNLFICQPVLLGSVCL